MKPLPIDGCVPRELLRKLSGKRVLITGPRGFSGRWMLETLQHADIGAEILTLDSDDRRSAYDVPRFDYCAHCATDGEGIGHLVDRANKTGGKVLYLSSGAVYGRRMDDASGESVPLDAPVAEDSPTMPTTKYGEMKVAHERVCRDVAVIARMFSFVGPGLRRHVGREFLEADPVFCMNSHSFRSFMYASDLARWLWTLLLRGEIGSTYNVGSDYQVTVGTFGLMCARVRGVDYQETFEQDGGYYAPNTWKARRELDLIVSVSLEEAIRRTVAWQSS